MAAEDETATARIPVKPSTLRDLQQVTGKGKTYDEKIREYVDREKCAHDWGRRTMWRRVCRRCGAVGP
jgi:hypothetical protein